MASDLEISDLRAFAAAVRAGSITRGAAALGLTQPAASQRIHRLERALGEKMLHRQTRGTMLTGAGENLLAYAERILALHDEAHAALRQHGGTPAGHRTVALLEDLAVATLPGVLADFAALHPQIELEVIVNSAAALRRLAAQGRLDLAVGDPSVMNAASLRWRRQVALTWACTASFDLAQEPLPLVMFSLPCQWRQLVLDALSSHGRTWRISFQSTSLSAVQAAIAAGIGVAAILPVNLPPASIRPGKKSALPAAPRVDIAISRRAGTETDPAIDSLERLLRRAVDDKPDQDARR